MVLQRQLVRRQPDVVRVRRRAVSLLDRRRRRARRRAGYEHFNSSTSADPFVLAGLTSQVALELRFALDAAYDNQLLLAPGLGYEHITFSPTDPDAASVSTNALVPRVRFGYRHLIETAAALEFSIDVGVGKWFLGADAGSLDIPATALVAANMALVWAL